MKPMELEHLRPIVQANAHKAEAQAGHVGARELIAEQPRAREHGEQLLKDAGDREREGRGKLHNLELGQQQRLGRRRS